jgi:hypothetical protein
LNSSRLQRWSSALGATNATQANLPQFAKLLYMGRDVHADAIVRKAQDSGVPLGDRAVAAVKSASTMTNRC